MAENSGTGGTGEDAFLAIDWGTTNRRVYRIEGGKVVATERDDRGVKVLAPTDYAAIIAADRRRFGDLPVLIAGMAGSTIGWCDVSYAAAPAGLPDLVANIRRMEGRIAIVPGVSIRGEGASGARADVMRGEEVQLLGAAVSGMVLPDSLLCQPGTHCKWAVMRGGKIASFTTAITGELFALLRGGSVLSAFLGSEVTPDAAFVRGVHEGARRDVAASLFSVRAASVLGDLPEADAASFCSGILLGSDVSVRLEESPGETVSILSDPALGGLYRAAIEALGGSAVLIDSHEAFVAGITAIRKLWV